jgi:hypothetical protein
LKVWYITPKATTTMTILEMVTIVDLNADTEVAIDPIEITTAATTTRMLEIVETMVTTTIAETTSL